MDVSKVSTPSYLRIQCARHLGFGVIGEKHLDTQDGICLINDLGGLNFNWRDADPQRLIIDIECL